MNDLSVRVRASLWWLLPLALLAVLIGWEIDWGNAVRLRPPPAEAVAPQAVTTGLLPDYVIAGGIASHARNREPHAVQPDPPAGAGGDRGSREAADPARPVRADGHYGRR